MVEVLTSGLHTSIQDLGRFKYRRYGVPVSGPMDYQSAIMANQLLGNMAAAPLLEITMTGPTLRFNEACRIAITGAQFLVLLDDTEVKMGAVIEVAKYQILSFKALQIGLRAYLAISGGFISESKLGSVSQLTAITSTNRLSKGEVLRFNAQVNQLNHRARIKYSQPNFQATDIEVWRGPEFSTIDKTTQLALFNAEFMVSNQTNRMGARLTSSVHLKGHDIITAPVLPGTVQLTPSGQLIALGQDAQTTGGYARVLQLTRKGMDCLAQKPPQSLVRFLLAK